MRDSSARMSSYCLSRKPTISEKLRRCKSGAVRNPFGLHYLASLSIWSPNPGVSTMVSEMRVPSSSSSSSDKIESVNYSLVHALSTPAPRAPTNCDGLDLHALLDMGDRRVIRVLVLQNLLAAQSVDEGCPS